MIRHIPAKGFTLVEILISLFILSLIGIIITTGLDLVVKTQLRVERKYKLLSEVQLALTIMESDLQEITDRPILNEKGQIQPAVQISKNNLEFTRSGFVNPFSMNKRSTLQRVAYIVDGSKLIRRVWPALDRSPASLSEDKIILQAVKDFSIQVIKSPSPARPSKTGSTLTDQGDITNKGIIIEMTIGELGHIKRIFAISSNNFEISHVETL